jgi:hypothetical protein
VVSFLNRRHAGADVDHDPGPFVAEDHREQPLGIGPRARELVGVADAGRLDLHQHLARLRPFQVDFFDHQRLACRVRHRRMCFHGSQT